MVYRNCIGFGSQKVFFPPGNPKEVLSSSARLPDSQKTLGGLPGNQAIFPLYEVTRCFPSHLFEVTRCLGVFSFALSKTSLVILEPRSGLVLGLYDLFGAGFEAISGPGSSPRPFLAGLAALPSPFPGWFLGLSDLLLVLVCEPFLGWFFV